jgi:hypothetical protein
MARRTTPAIEAELADTELPGLEDLPQDPAPAPARRGRPRKAAAPVKKAAGNRGRIPTRTATGRIRSKAELRAQVGTEVYTWLTLAAGAWEMTDPDCAGLLYEATPQGQERLMVVAERLTNMLCRNDSVAEFIVSSGIVGDAVALLGALLPIGKAVFKAHGPGGHGHRSVQEVRDGWERDFPAYDPAYTGAAPAA